MSWIYPKDNEAFLAGLIAVRRNEMLDSNKLERLLNAPSSEKAMGVLAEIPTFMPYFQHGSKMPTIEELIKKEIVGSAKWLKKFSIDNNWLRVALFPGDLHNFKENLKSELTGSAKTTTKACFGDKIFENDEISNTAKKDYQKNKDLRRVDMITEQAAWGEMLKFAHRENSGITKYTRTFIDFRNYNLINRNPDIFDEFFTNGGFIEKHQFKNNIESIKEEFSINHDIVQNEFIEIGYLRKILLKIKQEYIDGPSVPFAYFMLLRQNAIIIRTILEFKKAGLEIDKNIQKIIRDYFQ